MLIDQGFATLPLTVLEEVHHLGVLAKVVGELILGQALCDAQLLDLRIEALIDADQGRVLRSLDQGQVEEAVLLEDGGTVADTHRVLAVGSVAGELLHIGQVPLLVDGVDGQLLEGDAYPGDIQCLLIGDDADQGVAPWLDGHQAVLGQAPDRLTDRGAADAELFSERLFGDLHPALELSVENLFFEHRVDLVAETALDTLLHSTFLLASSTLNGITPSVKVIVYKEHFVINCNNQGILPILRKTIKKHQKSLTRKREYGTLIVYSTQTQAGLR